MPDQIPFNRPALVGRELEYLKSAVSSGHTSAGGQFSERVSALLADWHGAEDVLLTTSCTDALEMTSMLLGIGPGDAVIVPSFTFTSTALAYARTGAVVRFCDVDPITLAADPSSVEALVDERVRAIVTVHYAGIPGDIEGLLEVSNRSGIPIIEDNAHGLFATLDGRPLGTFGRMSTLSFHETKNFSCGEGGALVLNSSVDVDNAHIFLDKGTNRRAFMLGQVDKYTWQSTGSSFGLSDLNAAYLLAQLQARDDVLRERHRVATTYRELISPIADEFGLQLPAVVPGTTPADHMFFVLFSTSAQRDDVLQSLRSAGVHATFHYVPLHSSPAGRRFTDRRTECPVTDDVSSRLLRLPFYNELEGPSIERVVAALVEALQTT